MSRSKQESITHRALENLVHIMILEVGVDMAAKRIQWVKTRPDYEPLFSILNGVRQDDDRRFWLERSEAQENHCETGADTGRSSTGIEILLQVSDKTLSRNTLTRAEEYVK